MPFVPSRQKKNQSNVHAVISLGFWLHLYLSALYGTGISASALQMNQPGSVPKCNENMFSRQSFVSSSMSLVLGAGFLASSPSPALAQDIAQAVATTPEVKYIDGDRRVYKLMSGVQFGDVRVGGGDIVSKSVAVSDSGTTGGQTIILHLRALRMDGSVLFDTRLDGNGSPILHRIGTAQDFDYFGGDSSKRPKVTQGVEDAILSRGRATYQGSTGEPEYVDPMRFGGVRLAVVPGSLAYGHAGVSRYDAFRMGLRTAVPRDEVLRYEIELLRCLSVPVEVPSNSESVDGNGKDSETSTATETRNVEVCCTEDTYPCKTSSD